MHSFLHKSSVAAFGFAACCAEVALPFPTARFFLLGYARLSWTAGHSPRGREKLPREVIDLAHIAPAQPQKHLRSNATMAGCATAAHRYRCLAKYCVKNASFSFSATGRAPIFSPNSMVTCCAASNAGQFGRPLPFGLPVLAKFAQ